MNTKEKAKRGERQPRAAVEFIVPLQLEQCLYHINHQPRGMSLRVTVESAEDGTMHLNALLRHNGVVTVRCEGELRRWEGTSTQVVGQRENCPPATKTGNIWEIGCGCLMALITLSLVGELIELSSIQILFPLNFAAGFAVLLGSFLIINVIWSLVHRLISLYRRRLRKRELMVRLKRVLNGTEKY